MTLHHISNKFNSKWVIDLTKKSESVKILRENIGAFLFDHAIGKNFLNSIQNSKIITMMKNTKLNSINRKNSDSSKHSLINCIGKPKVEKGMCEIINISKIHILKCTIQ